MEEAGFEDMEAYVPKRHNMVAQYIAAWTIMELCKETVRRPGSWVARILWEHEGLELSSARTAATAEADGEG